MSDWLKLFHYFNKDELVKDIQKETSVCSQAVLFDF
jgi:hypothetical protein